MGGRGVGVGVGAGREGTDLSLGTVFREGSCSANGFDGAPRGRSESGPWRELSHGGMAGERKVYRKK